MSATDLVGRRNAAITGTGWGASVGWRQPRNACLWVFVAVIAYGLWYTFDTVRVLGGTTGQPLAISAIIFSLYGVVFWWFTTHIDRYSSQPLDLRVAAFLWGGFGATWTIALHSNTALIGILGKLFGQDFANGWGAGIAAPLGEELGKGAGVLLLLFIAPRVMRTAFDGFVIGAFVGLGFEIIEDILYAINSAAESFGADPVGTSLHTVMLRLGTGFSSHIVYSAIFGAGVVYLVGTRAQKRRLGLGLLLCATSMLLHGTWDSTLALAGGNSVVVGLLLLAGVIVSIFIVVCVFHLAVAGERRAMRDVLAPEVADGTLTDDELVAVSGAWKQRRRFRRAGGVKDRRRRGHRLEAAHDLADELGAARGEETDRVRFARSELKRFAAER
ncbi:PrsW family intramembrane metalloprotease [Aeromicrobium sp. Leaf245]|uniref:PrsW family intramembrane metalloprotease n=1 Tax=Aeromicrobium sp. Leaf245 TaxID=1736306 RepID=UPI0006F2E6A8|nr:PrsW family intramembrane metalloprotease [Aeromicrobium sp. Leaf245]KQO39541.1 hypothetical protein ASF05_16055 [Aeromicrobium sp. Leaf245]